MSDREPTTNTDARAALLTAAAYSSTQANGALIPEALLLAILYDPSLHDTAGPVAEETRLRRAMLESNETRDDQGWSPRARAAYQRAWKRGWARERERPIGERLGDRLRLLTRPGSKIPAFFTRSGRLSVGDLLDGLSGAGDVVDAILRTRALNPHSFDDESPLPGVAPLDGIADDALVDVVLTNDDVTPMKFVVAALEEHFACTQMRALSLMYRVHVCGRARIARRARAEAERCVAQADEAARAAGHPLAFTLGPRAL
jgi:ATP-dependent Clp protease adapter protein ClpS